MAKSRPFSQLQLPSKLRHLKHGGDDAFPQLFSFAVVQQPQRLQPNMIAFVLQLEKRWLLLDHHDDDRHYPELEVVLGVGVSMDCDELHLQRLLASYGEDHSLEDLQLQQQTCELTKTMV